MAGLTIWFFLVAAVATGCGSTKADRTPALPSDPRAANAAGQPQSNHKRVFQFEGNAKRPEYRPNKNKQIEFIEVGKPRFVFVGHGVNGGAWRHVAHDGGVVGFSDGSKTELPQITLVYDNWTNKLVAVEVPDN